MLMMRQKVWLDARTTLKQHRASRTISVTPADAAPVSGRLPYREVLRRAAAAAAAAVADSSNRR
ncbi:MAG TPA: hypothetical protein VF322_13490 [Gammaproteobacteria bacterium]